jgi:hypothetical protein
MILTCLVQVLQELNSVLLIVSSRKAPFALVFLSWRPAHTLPLFFILGGRPGHKIHLLVVVLGQVGTVNTTIIAFDHLLFLDTHSHEFLKCPLLFHVVIVDLKGLKLLW